MQSPPISWLLDAASKRPADVAIRYGETAWTYERVADEALRAADVLASRGFEPGARVGLVLGSGPAYVTSLLGTLAAGLTAVPLSPLLTPHELVSHVRRNSLAAMIADLASSHGCAAAMASAEAEGSVFSMGAGRFGTDISALIATARPAEAAMVGAHGNAIILHTAGSTGRSKLVPRTNAQVAAECDSIVRTLAITPDDVIFGILPLHHCYGLFNALFAALRAQCVLNLFLDPRPIVLARDDVLPAMSRERVTIVPAIPFQIEMLLPARGQHRLESIRLCYTGGAALKASTYAAFRDRFGIRVRQHYGCTEAGALTLNLDEEPESSSLTVGKPLAGVSISVIDADDSGEGELFVRSESLTNGYEGMDELNREVFVNDGFRTGDLGRVDEAGNLILTRRRPIYIDVAGHKVDSSEVEDVLSELPGVTEVLVIATDSARPSMKAVLACTAPLERRIVRDFCRSRLASYKIPSVIEFCEQLPRNELGKRVHVG